MFLNEVRHHKTLVPIFHVQVVFPQVNVILKKKQFRDTDRLWKPFNEVNDNYSVTKHVVKRKKNLVNGRHGV